MGNEKEGCSSGGNWGPLGYVVYIENLVILHKE